MRSRNCTQIWCTLRSAISVTFEILVKKLQVKDTEAYQEMMRISYETFWGISTAIFSHFTICHFGLSPFLAKLLT